MDDYNETTLDGEDELVDIDNIPKRRIDKWEFYLMLIVAIFIDSAQIAITVMFSILGAGPIGLTIAEIINRMLWIFGWIIFTIWFQLKGIRLFENQTAKMLAKRVGLFIAGFIPMVGSLPDFTILVIMIYAETKMFDEKKIKKFEEVLSYLEYLEII